MSKKPSKKSNLTYKYQFHDMELKDGKVVQIEKNIMEGPRGISFKFFKQNGAKKLRYKGIEKDGKFVLLIMQDDKKSDMNFDNVAELLKKIKSIKELDFVHKFMSQPKNKNASLTRLRSRLARLMSRSIKKSRKRSRKRSRKSKKSKTKKGSKKRRRSRKASRSRKRRSKKGSKKRKSRKGSKKRSRKRRRSRK